MALISKRLILCLLVFGAFVSGTGATQEMSNDNYHSEIRRDQDPSVEMEELLHAAGFDMAIVSLRNPGRDGEWLEDPIISRAIANQGMRASWPAVLDALFFIREMAPNLARRPRSGRPLRVDAEVVKSTLGLLAEPDPQPRLTERHFIV